MALGTRQRNASRHPRAAAGAVGHMLAPAAAALLPASCATLRVDPLPDPIRPPRTLAAEATEGAATTAPQEEGTTITSTPGVVIQRTVAEGIADRLGEDLAGPPIAVSFHDVPLVTFINEVFAERLGMSFTLLRRAGGEDGPRHVSASPSPSPPTSSSPPRAACLVTMA